MAEKNLPSVLACFHQRDINAAVIGRTDHSKKVTLQLQDATELLWDFQQQSLIGCGSQKKLQEDSYYA